MNIYVIYVMGNVSHAQTKYSDALEYVLSRIAELTGEPYTGSTEEELDRYLDDNCDVAGLEVIQLYDD
jgi:hypothetical protein